MSKCQFWEFYQGFILLFRNLFVFRSFVFKWKLRNIFLKLISMTTYFVKKLLSFYKFINFLENLSLLNCFILFLCFVNEDFFVKNFSSFKKYSRTWDTNLCQTSMKRNWEETGSDLLFSHSGKDWREERRGEERGERERERASLFLSLPFSLFFLISFFFIFS